MTTPQATLANHRLEIRVARTLDDFALVSAVRTLVFVGEQDCPYEEEFDGYAFVRLNPETGRTHQIRVHMAKIRMPVACDSLYGREQRIYYFAKDARPEAIDAIPDGMEISENKQTGLPVLRRIRQPA